MYLKNTSEDTNITRRRDSLEQNFPIKLYASSEEATLFDSPSLSEINVRHGITENCIDVVQNHFGSNEITKDDLFYYVYGILHSPEYKEIFRTNQMEYLVDESPSCI